MHLRISSSRRALTIILRLAILLGAALPAAVPTISAAAPAVATTSQPTAVEDTLYDGKTWSINLSETRLLLHAINAERIDWEEVGAGDTPTGLGGKVTGIGDEFVTIVLFYKNGSTWSIQARRARQGNAFILSTGIVQTPSQYA